MFSRKFYDNVTPVVVVDKYFQPVKNSNTTHAGWEYYAPRELARAFYKLAWYNASLKKKARGVVDPKPPPYWVKDDDLHKDPNYEKALQLYNDYDEVGIPETEPWDTVMPCDGWLDSFVRYWSR